MITFKLGDLQNQTAGAAFRKIGTFTEFSSETSFRMGKLVSQVQSQMNRSRDLWLEILNKYCEMDKKGEPKMTPGGDFVFKTPECEEGYKKDHEKMLKTEVTLKIWQIPLKELEKVRLSPNELMSVQFIVTDLPDESKAPGEEMPTAPNVLPMDAKKVTKLPKKGSKTT